MKTPFWNQTLKQIWCSLWGHSPTMGFDITKCDGTFPAVVVVGSCLKCGKRNYMSLKINWEEFSKLPKQNGTK